MTSFNAQQGLVIVVVTISGPNGNRSTRLALDTGASSTLISKEMLVAVGYDPDSFPRSVNFTTGSGVESASRVPLDKPSALGQVRQSFTVIAHTLPPSAGIDGVLGLDFMRDNVLTIDFKLGVIRLV